MRKEEIGMDEEEGWGGERSVEEVGVQMLSVR